MNAKGFNVNEFIDKMTDKTPQKPTQKPVTSTPVQHHTSTPVKGTGGVVKATYYLTPEILEAIEQRWLDLRQTGERVSKSHIVERALWEYLER